MLRAAGVGFTHRCSRGGGCGSSSGSSGATSTAACSPTSTSDARFVNAELVRRGLARTLTIPPNDRFAPLFERLELAAARAGRGLWGACGAVSAV